MPLTEVIIGDTCFPLPGNRRLSMDVHGGQVVVVNPNGEIRGTLNGRYPKIEQLMPGQEIIIHIREDGAIRGQRQRGDRYRTDKLFDVDGGLVEVRVVE